MADKIEYLDGATLLDPDEMEGLIQKHVTTRSELNHLEQANIQEGLRWLERQNCNDVLDDIFIRELHKQMLGDVWTWAGTYRKTEKNIGVDPAQINMELRNLIDDVKYWIQKKVYSQREIAARFHHRLVQIHLFPNGNGRHSRIVTNILLTNMLGEKAIEWGNEDTLLDMNEYRKEYITSLKEADAGDYARLLKFIG
jgi:Fic-DOC domain mobile mystery protein B